MVKSCLLLHFDAPELYFAHRLLHFGEGSGVVTVASGEVELGHPLDGLRFVRQLGGRALSEGEGTFIAFASDPCLGEATAEGKPQSCSRIGMSC